MNAIYPGSVLSLIKKAYVNRKSKEIEENQELIEITPIMKSEIDEVIGYKSKIYCVSK